MLTFGLLAQMSSMLGVEDLGQGVPILFLRE
jgi:hypothetical protein